MSHVLTQQEADRSRAGSGYNAKAILRVLSHQLGPIFQWFHNLPKQFQQPKSRYSNHELGWEVFYIQT